MDPNEFFKNDERVRALIDLRKKQVDPSKNADDIKRTLCEKIFELNQAGVGLRQRIIAISDIDPELSAYISALESINGGIWCAKCNTVKTLGLKPIAVTEIGGEDAPQPASVDVTKLQAHLYSAQDALGLLIREQKQFQTQIDLLTLKLESYSDELAKIRGGPRLFTDANSTTNSGLIINDEVPNVAAPIFPPIRIEDLPPMPELKLDFTLPEDNISSDFLLE